MILTKNQTRRTAVFSLFLKVGGGGGGLSTHGGPCLPSQFLSHKCVCTPYVHVYACACVSVVFTGSTLVLALLVLQFRAPTIHFPTKRDIYRYKGHDTLHDTIHYCARQN